MHGGHVVAAGTVSEVCASKQSLTGQYLSGVLTMDRPRERRKGNGKQIVLHGAREHNLKNLTVSFPLGTLIAITGVSGSGKSSLLSDLLFPVLSNRVSTTRLPEGDYDSIEGVQEIDKVINIDQSPSAAPRDRTRRRTSTCSVPSAPCLPGSPSRRRKATRRAASPST